MPLRGETTTLRAIELTDAERAFRWVNDREVTEHLALRKPVSMLAEQAWAERAVYASSYRQADFAIEITATGEHIGNCGLETGDPIDRSAELGVMIGARDQWGHGYGYDALRTLIAFAFREMNLRRVWLRVDANHPRAVALYERLGFQTQAYLEQADWHRGGPRDVLLMVISRALFDELYGATEEVGDVPRG